MLRGLGRRRGLQALDQVEVAQPSGAVHARSAVEGRCRAAGARRLVGHRRQRLQVVRGAAHQAGAAGQRGGARRRRRVPRHDGAAGVGRVGWVERRPPVDGRWAGRRPQPRLIVRERAPVAQAALHVRPHHDRARPARGLHRRAARQPRPGRRDRRAGRRAAGRRAAGRRSRRLGRRLPHRKLRRASVLQRGCARIGRCRRRGRAGGRRRGPRRPRRRRGQRRLGLGGTHRRGGWRPRSRHGLGRCRRRWRRWLGYLQASGVQLGLGGHRRWPARHLQPRPRWLGRLGGRRHGRFGWLAWQGPGVRGGVGARGLGRRRVMRRQRRRSARVRAVGPRRLGRRRRVVGHEGVAVWRHSRGPAAVCPARAVAVDGVRPWRLGRRPRPRLRGHRVRPPGRRGPSSPVTVVTEPCVPRVTPANSVRGGRHAVPSPPGRARRACAASSAGRFLAAALVRPRPRQHAPTRSREIPVPTGRRLCRVLRLLRSRRRSMHTLP